MNCSFNFNLCQNCSPVGTSHNEQLLFAALESDVFVPVNATEREKLHICYANARSSHLPDSQFPGELFPSLYGPPRGMEDVCLSACTCCGHGPPVALLLPSCCPPVALLLPSCYPPVALLLPSCCPPVAVLGDWRLFVWVRVVDVATGFLLPDWFAFSMRATAVHCKEFPKLKKKQYHEDFWIRKCSLNVMASIRVRRTILSLFPIYNLQA